MAPSSARQFASPSRLKFSRPLSPSMSVVQPPMLPGIIEQAATNVVAASASDRFMGPPPGKLRRILLPLQLLGEESRDLADAVRPGFGVAAGGGAAAARRRRIDARGHVAHRGRAVEGVVRAGVALERHALARGTRDPAALLGRRPVVELAGEDQERRIWAV